MAPDSGAPPISARRAYAEVLILFALVFASGIINAAESFGGTDLAPSGSWGAFAPGTVQEVCDAAIIVIAVVLLSARRGVTGRLLGTRMPEPLAGVGPASRAIRMAAMGLLAFFVGGIITGQLAGGHGYPQPRDLSVPYLVYSVGGSLFSGVVEEMVALAFVVSTLRQARRPAAEVVVVAVLLRMSYHVYYGTGIVGIAVWATVFALLYLRFRSVIPLIVLHFLWDSFQFLGLKWTAFAALGSLLGSGLLITALIMWIVAAVNHRDANRRQRRGFAPPPGATYPVPPYPAAPVAPYPGAPYSGAPFPGAPVAPYPGAPVAPYPGAPYSGAPFPGTPYPGAPFPGAPFPGAPYPGALYPGAPYPVAQYPGAPSPWMTGQPQPTTQHSLAYPPPHDPGFPPGHTGPPAPPAYPPPGYPPPPGYAAPPS
jgi:membrane protease YdiL (CAAX protease family)